MRIRGTLKRVGAARRRFRRHSPAERVVERRRRVQPTAPCAFKRDNALASYVALLVSAFAGEIPSRPPPYPPPPRLTVPHRVVAVVRRDSFAVRPLNAGPTRQSNGFPITPDATGRIAGWSAFNNTRRSPPLDRTHEPSPRNHISFVSHFSLGLSVPRYPVCLLARVTRYDNGRIYLWTVYDLTIVYAILRRYSEFMMDLEMFFTVQGSEISFAHKESYYLKL